MSQKSWIYRFTSTVMAISLLLQLLVPVISLPGVTAVQAAPSRQSTQPSPAAKAQSSPLAAPAALSRYQSSASSGDTIVITYSVTNNQPPTLDADISLGTTVTDTVAILAAMDLAEDMNTLHNTELTMTLTNGVLVDGSGANQNGSTLTWNLGDILPLQSKVVTVTVAAPAAAPDFVELDDGARVTTVRWNTPVAATARPAQVIPDTIDPDYVMGTVDADIADEDMLWAAAAFTQDPAAAFNMVKTFAYDPYKGSLHGTRGTLWGESGNALDQSSLLIAMLRAAGIPARYRHGTLDTAQAQTLLASMFASPQGSAGYLPAAAVLADPLNDTDLLTLAQDHWWVEAYLPGVGWTDLDPTFPNAVLGDMVATPATDGSDRIAAVPDALHHKVYMALEVEQYNSFPIGGTNLSTTVPLTATFDAAQVASKSVILGHLLNSDAPPGLVFSSVEHTYTPYFGINGDKYVVSGESFSDLMTSFPLASHFTTAEWITFELTDANGNSQTFTREVKDTIGVATRLLGGVVDITSPADNAPFISFEDAFVADFLPNLIRNASYAQRHEAELQYDLIALAQATEALPKDDLTTPEAQEQAGEIRYQGEIARALLYSLTGLDFAFRSDALTDTLAENLRVNLFYDQSRVIIMHGTSMQDSATRTVDLRNTTAQAIVAPGQAQSAARTAQWVKAVAESYFEGDALRDASGQEPITTARIFETAVAQNIDLVYVTPDDLDLLDLYLPDPDAYGYAAAALLDGQDVLIPTEPVLINGQSRLGWWEINPESGAAVSVLDNGLHGALMEYATLIKKMVTEIKDTWENFGESVDQLWSDCIVDNVVPALQGNPGGSGTACLDGWEPPSPWSLPGSQLVSSPAFTSSTPWYYLPDHLCPIDNCGIEQFLLDGYQSANMPLPEAVFQYHSDGLSPQSYAGQLIPVTNSGGGGSPGFTLTPGGAATLIPMQAYGLDVTAVANFSGELEVWTYAPPGWSVGFASSSQAQIIAPENTPAGSYTILVAGQARHDRSLIASAEYVVTVPAQETISLDYEVEGNITVDMGPQINEAVSNQTNDGEAEIPDSAFKLGVTNNSSVTKTITLSVSGAPAGWVVLDGHEQTATAVTLLPFSRTRIGLYVKPPTQPAPGTSFIMNVTAVDGGSLSDSVSIPWLMPGQAHNFMQIEPQTLYVAVDGSVDFDLSITNVGNTSGAFPIAATTPISTWTVTGLPAAMTLAEGESQTAVATLNIVGGELGRKYPLLLAGTAPNSYTQYELATAIVVSQNTGVILGAAASCNAGSDALSAAFESLAFAVSDLETTCNAGTCDLARRDGVVDAANSAASYARIASPFVTEHTSLETVAAALAGHTNNADIEADLTALSTAVSNLSAELCVIEQHAASARFTPYVEAVLLGQSASFSLDVTNKGTQATTYDITVTGLPGGSQFFNETIPPGTTLNLPINPVGTTQGAYDIEATITPVGVGLDLTTTAVARLNVVDKFVQVTQVLASPDFVETSTSSTDLSVEIANVSGVAQDGNARTAVLAPDGSTAWTQDIPLTALAGNPRFYDLATVDTSGWAEGTYTVTVDFLDGTGALIPDGSGYGYFNVGQALVASQIVYPEIVAPGNVTVTTVITTEIKAGTIGSTPLIITPQQAVPTVTQPWQEAAFLDSLAAGNETSSLLGGPDLAELYAAQAAEMAASTAAEPTNPPVIYPLSPVDESAETAVTLDASEPLAIDAPMVSIGSVFTRTEQDDTAVIYTGTWTNLINNRTSGGSYYRNNVAGSTAQFSFTGNWLNVGFLANTLGGQADIAIDGISQGVFDLYRREETAVSFVFDGLSSGSHSLTITVLGTANPLAANHYVLLDYIDAWDSSTLSDGAFEQDDVRVIASSGWSTVTDASASGGSYIRSSSGATWFPFSGDSFSFHAVNRPNNGHTYLYVDGQFLANLDTFSFSTITQTYSFDGFGPGPHILQVSAYRRETAVDAFATPGTAPFYNPPAPSGIIRYEEDDPALLYNGLPFSLTATTWNYNNNLAYHSSEGYYAYSSTPGDEMSLAFDGTWFGIGFLTWRTRGIADVYLDGSLLDSVDLYTLAEDTKSVYYTTSPGTHTVSVVVSGSSHVNAVGAEVAVDYIDVWDGTAVADGTFEETALDRLTYSPGWNYSSEAAASGGGYAQDGNANNGTVWFPFSGDSVSFLALAKYNSHEIRIKIDGVPMSSDGVFDIYSEQPISRTFSFDGLGAGPHVMEVRGYRYDTAVDAFITPAITPAYQEAVPAGIIRYEEDDPALRYNGYPFQQTEYCFLNCWFMSNWRSSSGAYVAESRHPGDWVELEFYGSWAGVGFGTGSSGGVAEVFIDGTSMTTVTLTSPQDVTSVYFSDLITGTHTISVSNVSGRLYFDFFDIWDGTPMADGWIDANLEDHRGPYYFSALSSWYTQYPEYLRPRIQFAREGDVLSRSSISYNTHLWFTFTGNDLAFLPFQKGGETLELFIDGVSQGVLDLTAEYSDQPLAVYYNNLGSGPHVVHVNAVGGPYIDAFRPNPPDTLPYTPVVEWNNMAPADVYTTTYTNSGLLTTVGIGDLEGDGVVEIVVPASNGQLYVYRGDGQDTGDGDPILWQSDLVGVAAEPTLADLDGDGQSEIIVMGSEGTAAFHADGSVYWFTDTIKSTIENAGWGGSSVGNLDLEPGPEIVLAAHNDALYVLDHDGTILASQPTGALPAVPTLADVTGDGILDIIFAQDKTITAYDYFNSFNVAWTYTHTYPGFYGQAFGSPAVVDVDGKQPGGDNGPEIIINWGHYVDVLDADGSFLWNYYTGNDNHRRPSPVTIADLDGDNEIEILTASALQSGFLILEHTLLALNADGTLLWSQSMGDTSASASGVATQDLDGDGVWEVIWNGLHEGFTIIDGPTGTKLFNEEFTESGTFVDYPALGDVDGDGYAEVVTGGYNGLFVIGHDGVWGDSRPLWNQHNYHVTNINDDWSVPMNEPNNWDIHNTYRTQTPDRNPTPAYQIVLTYTAGLNNVTVLTDTASVPLTAVSPTYTWTYHQQWYQPIITTTFDSLLADMQPGEVRLVSQGTQIGYQLPSGMNYLTLPPTYVAAPRIVTMSPAEITAAAGTTAVYDITLSNPDTTSGDTYTLSLAGIPDAWASYPAAVPLAAGQEVTVTLTVNVPADAAADTLPVIGDVTNGAGGSDQTMVALTIIAGLEVTIEPDGQTAVPGETVTYTLTITNQESIAHTYDLTATGLANVSLPPAVVVPGGSVVSVIITVSADNQGPQPFTITATGDNGASDHVDAILNVESVPDIGLTLAPDPAVTGPGSTAVLTTTVTNLGDLADTFDLSVNVPAGWTYELQRNGTAVNQVNLPPNLFNSAELLLLVTPDVAAAMGDYDVSVTAVPQSNPAGAKTITNTVQVSNRGVQVEILSGPTTLDPRDSGTWDVRVTNTGSASDTFDLQAAGLLALAGQFSADAVTLNPGQSQTVQLTGDSLDFVLPQTYAVIVAATSQANDQIQHQASRDVTFATYEAVETAWQPASQTITGTLTANFTLVITNTGNTPTTYQVTVNAPGASASTSLQQVTVPAHGVANTMVTVDTPGVGDYQVEGVVSSLSGGVSDGDTAVLTVTDPYPIKILLPVVFK